MANHANTSAKKAPIASGTKLSGSAADLLAAGVNNNAGGWRLSPGLTELEQRLLRWFAARLGLPATAGGYLTSGGSAANHDALVVARDRKAGWDVRRLGMAAGPPLTVYAPTTVHDTVQRGADMLGMGYEAVRSIPVDGRDHVDVAATRAAIHADLAAGHRPSRAHGPPGTGKTLSAEVVAAEIGLDLDGPRHARRRQPGQLERPAAGRAGRW